MLTKILLLLTVVFVFTGVQAQYIHKIKADSVLITNDSCNAELNLENGTRHVKGFLYNKGNGRTEFRKTVQLTDSSFVIGDDTITMHAGQGSLWQINGSNNLTPKPFPGTQVELDKPLYITGTSDGIQQFIKLHASQTQANPIIKITDATDHTLLETRAQYGVIPANGQDATNLYVGRGAGVSNVNVFSPGTFHGALNTGIGDSALSANNTGTNNTALGNKVLKSNTTGIYNTAIGTYSLAANTTGQYNTALGAYSLYMNTTGNANTALGRDCLLSLTSGGNNVAVGSNALRSLASGSWNLGVGVAAGFGRVGGSENTFIGQGAGQISNGVVTTGGFNVFVGINAGRNSGATSTNNVVIGAYAADGVNLGNYKLYIGSSPLIYGEFDNALVKINGRLGVSTTPAAIMTLAAGAAAANSAPLKFTAGSNLSTPEAGAMEFDGSNYFVTTGTTRYTLAKTLTATAVLDFPSTAAQSDADLTITVAGAAEGDAVTLGVPNGVTSAGASYTAWVSAANTVTIRFSVYGTISRDPVSGTFRVSVLKY